MRTGFLFLLGLVISGMVTQAHHSLSGIYDTSRQVTLEGIVAQFQFINPHPFVTINVDSGKGKTETWQLEMDNRHELVEIGMNSQTLKKGDRVIVTGSPGRTQPQTLYTNRLDRPADGFRYEQIGSTPRVTTIR